MWNFIKVFQFNILYIVWIIKIFQDEEDQFVGCWVFGLNLYDLGIMGFVQGFFCFGRVEGFIWIVICVLVLNEIRVLDVEGELKIDF